MKNQIQRELEIFASAVKLASKEARGAYLEQACAGDAELRQGVEALLKAHEEANTFLQEPAAGPRPVSVGVEGFSRGEEPGDRIGRYKLLQVVGEGGMGVVYMAEQEEPVRRRVALKIIKLGMDTRQVVARFEAERQALALMDHPNIAKVLDGGTTETGRPFFVMELVQGVPITQFCDKNKLPAKERLKLFIQVCQAIQSAHQKGIIHRDIKPSNVLVTLHDGVPVPKVIDFGIAKATHQKLTEKTLFTNFATMIGTPAYMSPEQAEMSGLDIDTRTDVYALGVLLYELLTGTTPFPEKRLRSLAYGEMQRVILEEEPERPSTRLSTMANEQKTAIAKSHNEELTSLSRLLKGDLDWIVMKCLEKDRGRRYETANAVAADLNRHLENEPVAARPPSMAYRFQKMARRNKLAFGAAATVAVALLMGGAVSSWQAIRASRAERQKSTLLIETENARREEAKQRSIAEQKVYDSLVREARAIRLARKVGYRDKAFSLLQQAARIDHAQKNLDELRHEAVACLGDFVGNAPVIMTNWMPGFVIADATLGPSGRLASFRLWNKSTHKSAVILKQMPDGKELIRDIADAGSVAMGFEGSHRLVALLAPDEDEGKPRKERLDNVQMSVWTAETNGDWKKTSQERFAGAFNFVASPSRSILFVDNLREGIVELIDFETKLVIHRVPVSKAMKVTPRVVPSLSGRFLALQTAASPDDDQPEVSVWDLGAGREIRRSTIGASEVVSSISADGKDLITVNEDTTKMVVYDTGTLIPVAAISDMVIVGDTAVMPGREVVAVPLSLYEEVRLVDFKRNQTIATLDEPFSPFLVGFSATGRDLLTVGTDHACFYHLTDGKEIQHLDGRADAQDASFHPNGSKLATIGKSEMALWDVKTGTAIWRTNNASTGMVPSGVLYSRDGNLLFAGSAKTQESFLIDATTGRTILTLGTNAPGMVQQILLSEDGRNLVVLAINCSIHDALVLTDPKLGTVSVWEIAREGPGAGQVRANLKRSLVGKYCGATFLGGSTKLAFQDYDLQPSIYVWDFEDANSPLKLGQKARWGFRNMSASTDGKHLYMINADGRLISLDAISGQMELGPWDGLERKDLLGPCSVIASPDGSKLAVWASSGRSIEIFDVTSRRPIFKLPESSGVAWSFEWSLDSRQLVVARSNGDVAIWKLQEIDGILDGLGLKAN